MVEKPQLLIDYGAHSHPVSAKCSACEAPMPLMESKGASSAERIKWFEIQLDIHAKQIHSAKRKRSREDFSQAAARIVRESTRDK
jgi:hypothetical protein